MAEYLFEQEQLDQLDSNIRDMLSKGATQEDVMKYTEDYKNNFVKKKDGTTDQPSSQSASDGVSTDPPTIKDLLKSFNKPQVSDAPSTTRGIETKIKAQEKAQGSTPVLPTRQKHAQEVEAARKKIQTTLQTSDKILAQLIREQRVSDLEKQVGQTPTLGGMPNPALQTARRDLFINIPVTPEEITVKKNEALTDDKTARTVLKRTAKQDPSIAKSVYLIDAEQRVTEDPNRTGTIIDNARKIESGEIRYNINRGVLEKPENFIISGIRGFKERSKQLNDYDFFTQTMNDDAIIAQLEDDRKSYDPDQPVPVADGGTSQFTQMLGMEGIPMLKSSAAAIVTGAIPGAQAAVPLVAAAASAPEYYKRSYASAFRETYYTLRQRGVDEREALSTARKQAESEGALGAAEGAISSAIGAKIGLKTTPLVTSSGVKNALTNVVRAGGNFIKENIPEGVTDATVAGTLQIAKNIEARDNGLDRDILDGVDENVAGELLFTVGVGALTKAGRVVLNPDTYSTIRSFVAMQPKEVVDAKIGEMVLTGQITPNKAKEITEEIEKAKVIDAKIPDEISDIAVRANIQTKIEKREDLKKKLQTVDEVFHAPIKEQIKTIDQEILNLSSNATTESQVQEGVTEGNIGQSQGAVQGQPEVGQGEGQQGQAEIPKADAGDSDISSKKEVIKQKFDFVKDEDFVAEAFTPEEDAADRAALPESDFQSEQELETFLADGEYAMLTGMNPDAVALSKIANKELNNRATQWLADRGLKATPIFGKYGNSERSFLVPNMTKAQAIEFAKEFQQDSVAHSSGLVYKDGSFNPRTEGVSLEPRFDKGGDFFSSINVAGKPVDFSINYDFETTVPAEGMQVDEKGQLIDTKLEDAVAKASKSLDKSGIKFKIIDSSVNPEQADAARGNQAIFRDTDGTVTIDKSKLQNDIEAGIVVWHESSHPVMNIIRNTDRGLYDAVVRGLTDAAKKSAGVQKALDWAVDGYEGNDIQADEALVETIARIAEGVIDVSKLDTGLRQRIIDFINDIAKYFGIDPILNNTDLAEFKRVATQVADALSQGRDIAEVVGEENVKEYMNKISTPETVASGSYTPQSRIADGIDVYASKETESLPARSLQELYDTFGGKAVVINSDPTRVGELTLPSGKKIFMYGGPGYLSVKDNVSGNVGFATTQLSKVKTWDKYIKELFGNDKGVTFVATQAPTSILSNSYALRYVMDGISMLPKGVLKSAEFKAEFFGKDLVLLKDAFGEKAYNDFVAKYKKADLSNPEVIDGMISEMAYKVGDDNKPASFKARGAFVANLLGGVEARKKLKTVEGDTGYVSKKPTKYISSQLFNRLGINAERVMREIGEPSLVDLWFNEGKWGMVVSGFETDPNVSIESVQESGVKHPLFNAKFPGINPFVLDGAYEVDSMFKPVEITGPKGAPYTKRAAQMLAGSMYVKGQPESNETAFEYAPTEMAADRIQPSVGNRGDLVEQAGLRKKMTEDGDGNYVFFHYSNKEFKKVDPGKFGSSNITGRDERPGVDIAMFYTDPDTDETGGRYGYTVRIPKDKVYPFDEDPLNLLPQAEKVFKKQYPNQTFDANKQVGFVTKVAAERGFPMTVANWKLGGKKMLRAQTTEELPVKKYQIPEGLNSVTYTEEFVSNKNKRSLAQASVGNRSEEDLRAEGQGKERYRALASRFVALSEETQTKIDSNAMAYFQRPNKQTEKAVEDFIEGQNMVDMADYVLSNPDIPEVSKVWMAATVAKRLNDEIASAKADNDQDLVDALTDKQADIYNEFAKKATSLGQAVQAFVAFKNDPNATEFFLPKILKQLEKAGVKEVTETQKADIIQGLKRVNESKPGLPKDKAIIELSHYLAGLAPVKPIDVLQALWYAKILSGITTQATNFFANVFNTMFELPAVGMRIAIKSGDPMAVLYGIKGFGSGVIKGLVEGADIVKSGVRAKEDDKYFAENPLEYYSWSRVFGKKGKALDYIPPFNFGAWKYVGRVLAATDALFSTANQEAIANMLAYAETDGTPSRNKFRQVSEKLNNTKEKAVEAKKQAIREGFKRGSVQWKRRVIELIDQGRSDKLTAEADAIGKRITMNYDPEGWTKPIFDAVVGLQRNVPVIKMVIPFARIVANLTENALNYTPAGAARAIWGKRNPFNKKGEPLTTNERIDLMSKFAIGMGALAILATKVGDDDDDWFDITAGGPNDTQQKYELQKGGWRPYTIVFKDGTKLNYKDWPIAGILAGMGNIRDAKKYGQSDETSTALAAYGFFLNFYDKSLLSGLSDFFGIFNVNAGRGKYAPETKISERASKWAAQQVKSVALSNLSQQAGKLYSELVTGEPQRDAKTFMEIIYRDLPMFNDGIRPIIDVFGDEVKYNTTERLTPFMDDPEKDMIIKWLNENKLFVGVPKKTDIYDFETDTKVPMTDEQYYEYRKLAGKKTKEWILDFMSDIKDQDRQVSEAMFESAKRAARSEAYAELFIK